MKNSHISHEHELPSTAKLLKSTVIALLTAIVLLLTTVLPAEYGIDPTGVGQMLGLKRMGEIKTSLAKEAADEVDVDSDAVKETVALDNTSPIVQAKPEVTELVSEEKTEASPDSNEVEIADTPASEEAAPKLDTITITLEPDQGAEAKVNMNKGQTVTYKWHSSGGKTNFDVHGDSKALNINYHNYEKGSVKSKEGSVTAAFDGSHGWFWRNRTGKTLTITFEVTGDYDEFKRVL